MRNFYKKLSFFCACLFVQGSLSAQCGSITNLGSATNMITLIRNNSSSIAANKLLNTVVFIHRNNATAFGGNSGQLRFDVTTNGGASWALDQGVITPVNTNLSRYPNVALYNPAANTNTANVYLSYLAPTISSALVFNGDATGVAHLDVTGATETYNQNGIGTTLLPASLVSGSVGVFWAIEPLLAGNGFNIYKGVWNSSTSDVVWSINNNFTFSSNYFPSTVTSDYNIAFDPTGTIGYCSFVANLVGGPTPQTLYPVLYKTTNGGTTWTGPIIVDVTLFGCVASNTVSPNLPSVNLNHDLVVDVNGNPHYVTTMGNSSSYAFNYSLWHHMFDITLKNGLWVAYDLGNVNCSSYLRGVTTTFEQAQAPQACRSADGTKVFFTWTDMGGASLGSGNVSPDLYGKGFNVSTGNWTQTKNFTSCNANAAGKMIFPHCAAEALEPNSTTYLVPTMYGEPSVTNDLDQIANFRYLDNVTFTTSDFSLTVPPATVTINQGTSAVICQSSSLTLSIGSIAQAVWSNSATTTSISIGAGTVTTYSVLAQVGCNTGTASISVSNLSVNANNANPGGICPGGMATFSVLGNAMGYTWTPGPATGSNVSLGPLSNNTVTLTALGSASCTDVYTVGVTLLPPPTLTISGTNTICAGIPLSLTVSGASTYVWNDNSTNATFTDTPLTNTSYTVTGTAANTCTNVQSVSVTVKPSPTVNAVANPTATCLGQTVYLSASGASTYSWNGTASSSTMLVVPTASTDYTVTGTATNSCQTSNTVTVLVYALPNLTVTPARPFFCKGEKIKLTASGAVTYTWMALGLLNPSVQVNPTSTTVYTVDGTSAQGCINEKTFTLTVNPCTGIQEQSARAELLVYPNPNNGEFTIKGASNLELTLINELGQIVKNFSLNENNEHRVLIKDLSPGIYFLVDESDSQIRQKILITK